MKALILAMTVLFSMTAFASDDPMSDIEREIYMEKVSKDIRKFYWRSGYERVESRTTLYSQADLDEYVKEENNSWYHEPLDSDQIADLYRCNHEPKCELYLVRVTNSFHSGWGDYSHFIMLDVMEPRHQSIVHLVYGE